MQRLFLRALLALWLEHHIRVGFLAKCRMHPHLLGDKALLGTEFIFFLSMIALYFIQIHVTKIKIWTTPTIPFHFAANKRAFFSFLVQIVKMPLRTFVYSVFSFFFSLTFCPPSSSEILIKERTQ